MHTSLLSVEAVCSRAPMCRRESSEADAAATAPGPTPRQRTYVVAAPGRFLTIFVLTVSKCNLPVQRTQVHMHSLSQRHPRAHRLLVCLRIPDLLQLWRRRRLCVQRGSLSRRAPLRRRGRRCGGLHRRRAG